LLDKEKAKQEIQGLVDKYNEVVESGEEKDFNEEDTKKDYILPLFRALGWDVENRKEVTAEKKVSGGRVDYAFRIEGIPRFFLEAKSFKENLDDRRWIEQALNYAWLKGITWAILTNFKKIKIFNSEIKATMPYDTQFFEMECSDFINNFEKLALLSRDSLDEGWLDAKAEEWGRKKPKKPVDERLFSDLTKARELLSKNISQNNIDLKLSDEDLEESVQKIISRFIFVRTLEDKKYEEPILLPLIREEQKKGIPTSLNSIFQNLDGIYDARLFAHHLIDDLKIDPYPLRTIIESLYESEDQLQKYDFGAIDSDILGGIYEQYLSYVLSKSQNGIRLDEKTKKKKEGGKFYTPKYIVNYIIKNIFKELDSKNVDLSKLRILDPACGSGSFLIKVYDSIYERILKQKGLSEKESDTIPTLSYEDKVGLVQKNIFGVDLDPKAVEIAKLNLFLKVAEKKHTLPTLVEKIKSGNSLINDKEIDYKNSFDWNKEFSNGNSSEKFDVIIGNPPYIKVQLIDDAHLDYFYKNYKAAYKHFDVYTIFIEKAISLLKDGGILGFIVPSKFLNAEYGAGLRKIIGENKYLFKLVNFKDFQVFKKKGAESKKGARTYTCLLFLKKEKNEKFDYYELTNKKKLERTQILSQDILKHEKLDHPPGDVPWDFAIGKEREVKDKLEKIDLKLDDIKLDIFEGLQTGRDPLFCVKITKDEGDLVKIQNSFDEEEHLIEKRILKKLLKGREIRRWEIEWKNIYVIYPYNDVDGKTTLIPLEDIKKQYPHAFQYFTHYKDHMMASKSAEVLKESNFYRHRRSRSIGQFDKKKIIAQVLSDARSFSLDYNGEYYFVGGGTAGGFGIILKEKYEKYLYVVLALLNSKVLDFYLRKISSPFEGDSYAYGGQYIKRYPIILPSGNNFNNLTELTKKQISLEKRLDEIGTKITDEQKKVLKEIKENEDNINEIIYNIYEITPEERNSIEDAIN